MQPALADVVQNLTFPGSTATTGVFLAAIRSLPWCGPPGRACPKSSMYVVGPATGKISVGTEPFGATAATAVPARPSTQRRRRTPRAPVRWHIIKLRFALDGGFALEGADPSRHFGQKQKEFRAGRGNPVAH